MRVSGNLFIGKRALEGGFSLDAKPAENDDRLVTKYTDTVNDGLERIEDLGYERGEEGFVNHGPMCVETLATLGYGDQVASWVRTYRNVIAHHDPPEARFVIDPVDWRDALGDFGRAGDWERLFHRELFEEPWREVLVRWWPRLLPGMMAGLTHGVIRTAHAVRSLAATAEPSRAQLAELARGLAYWAARYTPLPGAPAFTGSLSPAEAMPALPRVGKQRSGFRGGRGNSEDTSSMPTYFPGYQDALHVLRPDEVQWRISEMTAEFAGIYLAHPEVFPVPLVHGVTAPAAVRLVLPHLPAELHESTLAALWQVQVVLLMDLVGDHSGETTVITDADAAAPPAFGELAARAVEHGDDHVIKLAEACQREHALRPDPRYAAAAQAAQQRIPHHGNAIQAAQRRQPRYGAVGGSPD